LGICYVTCDACYNHKNSYKQWHDEKKYNITNTKY